jgi:hypothetical protein
MRSKARACIRAASVRYSGTRFSRRTMKSLKSCTVWDEAAMKQAPWQHQAARQACACARAHQQRSDERRREEQRAEQRERRAGERDEHDGTDCCAAHGDAAGEEGQRRQRRRV